MYKRIILDGEEYDLVPVEKDCGLNLNELSRMRCKNTPENRKALEKLGLKPYTSTTGDSRVWEYLEVFNGSYQGAVVNNNMFCFDNTGKAIKICGEG